jgi:transposase-like protein
MDSQNRDEAVLLIRRLIAGEAVKCPRCAGADLTHFHQKAKKSNLDWVCPACGKRFQVIRMMKDNQSPP